MGASSLLAGAPSAAPADLIAAHTEAAQRVWTSRGSLPADPALPLVEFRRGKSSRRPASSPDGVTAFLNVNVLPMDTRRILRNRTVIVRGDRIETIGKAANVAVPPGARRISGRGKYLIPGLADLHVHTSYRAEHIFYVANGVTTIRDMWGSTGHLAFRDAVLAGEEFGATMWVATPGFVGPDPVFERAVVLTKPRKARRAVQRHARAGYDFVKVHERLPAEAYEAIASKALQVGIPVIGHISEATGVDRVLAAGAHTSISHLHRLFPGPETSFWEALPDAASRIERAGTLRRLGIASDPTLATLLYALDAEGVEAFLARPELDYLPQWQIDSWVDWWNRFGPWRDPETAGQALRNLQAMVETLDTEGAPLLLGTDSGFPFLIPGFSIHEELALYVQAGLSPYRALRAATVAAAEYLGATDEFGLVREGLRADLVLLRRNPLRKIGNASRIEGVMLRGEWLTRKELKSRLEAVASSFD